MDVNEEIVKEWLHICKKQFTLESIRFKVYGPKGGSNYSDIDILAVDKGGNYYDYEIKWRSAYSLRATDKKNIGAFIKQVLRKERIEKIKEIIGNKPCKHIFVTTKQLFGRSKTKRGMITKEFSKRNITTIFFEDIIKELVSQIEVKGRYDSPILQTIRMLKYFKITKE